MCKNIFVSHVYFTSLLKITAHIHVKCKLTITNVKLDYNHIAVLVSNLAKYERNFAFIQCWKWKKMDTFDHNCPEESLLSPTYHSVTTHNSVGKVLKQWPQV